MCYFKNYCAVVFAIIVLVAHMSASAQSFTSSGTVELSPTPLDSSFASPSLGILGMNTSVAGAGALAFIGGYDGVNWSGNLKAYNVRADGSIGQSLWDAGTLLTHETAPDTRTILTATARKDGTIEGAAFQPSTNFDVIEMQRLMMPPSKDVASDNVSSRVNYLRGAREEEQTGVMRERAGLLGAIVHAEALYVGGPTGRYSSGWPLKVNGRTVSAPEQSSHAQSYDDFQSEHLHRTPMIYIGANDGMLHAIQSPIPSCQSNASDIRCTTTADAGKERWAYVPRAVYGNLGNLTSVEHFRYAPTVDATPVTRDVFFGDNGDHTWHSVLVGGLGLGGRGVYALDVSDPDAVTDVSASPSVLWEFDADQPAGVGLAGDRYDPADLGFSYGQASIARLAYGKWVVLIPSGYFADCSKDDKPLNCEASSGTHPDGYSALFVLDAQTGQVIRELKTPTDIDGVTSYGLSTAVLGDYNNDQVDDVAFAGDLAGNLWRFDLSSPEPAAWSVSLAYRPDEQRTQPITVMPRLFPDPATNRFVVVFGTGKYLGDGDISNKDVPVQSIIGIRDKLPHDGAFFTAVSQNLQAQVLHQERVTGNGGANEGAVLRTLSSKPVPQSADGWHIDLNVEQGERVVTTPTALFNTNTVLIKTLVPKGKQALPEGSLLAIDAATGGPGGSFVTVGGVGYAGVALNAAVTTNTLPMITPVGGGKVLFPGLKIKGLHADLEMPLSLDSSLWRRRSWAALNSLQ